MFLHSFPIGWISWYHAWGCFSIIPSSIAPETSLVGETSKAALLQGGMVYVCWLVRVLLPLDGARVVHSSQSLVVITDLWWPRYHLSKRIIYLCRVKDQRVTRSMPHLYYNSGDHAVLIELLSTLTVCTSSTACTSERSSSCCLFVYLQLIALRTWCIETEMFHTLFPSWKRRRSTAWILRPI